METICEDLGDLVDFEPVPPLAWTAVGSAGTVDDGDLNDVSLSFNFVRQKPASQTARDFSYVRYNVTAVGDLADPDVAFYDITLKGFDSDGNGALNDGRNWAHVVVGLFEADLRNGARSREIFNFNTKDALRDPGLFETTVECVELSFDWSGSSQYYVEVILGATTDSAVAEFQGISITRSQRQDCG